MESPSLHHRSVQILWLALDRKTCSILRSPHYLSRLSDEFCIVAILAGVVKSGFFAIANQFSDVLLIILIHCKIVIEQSFCDINIILLLVLT